MEEFCSIHDIFKKEKRKRKRLKLKKGKGSLVRVGGCFLFCFEGVALYDSYIDKQKIQVLLES